MNNYIMKRTPPCKPDCPNRSAVCHNVDTCEKWAKWQAQLEDDKRDNRYYDPAAQFRKQTMAKVRAAVRAD